MLVFLLNQVAVWTRVVPWMRWGHRAQSGWKNNTKFVDEYEWWMWCPHMAQGNNRRKPHASLRGHLKGGSKKTYRGTLLKMSRNLERTTKQHFVLKGSHQAEKCFHIDFSELKYKHKFYWIVSHTVILHTNFILYILLSNFMLNL